MQIQTQTISKYTIAFTPHLFFIPNVVFQQYSLPNPGFNILSIYKLRSKGYTISLRMLQTIILSLKYNTEL